MALISSVLALLAGLLGWAFWWPSDACDRPSCARQRFVVELELDALRQVAPIDLEIEDASGAVSLASILRDGGIELSSVLDDLDLPYDPQSGPLDRADLAQFVRAWHNRAPSGPIDAQLYALFVNAIVDDNGSELFGMMFDTRGREAFAVAPRTTERLFGTHEAERLPALKLRTFAHELLHALNRHHTDAAQSEDGRLTLEAPTRCISNTSRHWQLREEPLMAMSPSTIRFFQTGTAREILPGKANSPFIDAPASSNECDEARSHRISFPSRWSAGLARLRSLFLISDAQAQETDPAPSSIAATLQLQAQTAPYPLGYPIALRIMAHNTGEKSLPIVRRLDPRYGMVTVEYRGESSDEWQTLQPTAFFEATSDDEAELAPGERTEATIPVYFGKDGWTFKAPGTYELRARLAVGDADEDIVSAPIRISIESPRTARDQEALQALLDDSGGLDESMGELLSFGGRVGDRGDLASVKSMVESHLDTALGNALRLTVLVQSLRPAIDPLTGRRPPANLDEAREVLADTCTDSGMAAMTSNLLGRHAARAGAQLGSATAHYSNASAWDGRGTAGSEMATYSDPALHALDTSVNFCFNDSTLTPSTRASMRQLARTLKRAQTPRIVLVGHTDAAGTCRYNDDLGLRRARSVRDALISAGVARGKIEIASIGERHPADFASSEDAHSRNRRVDILIAGEEVAISPIASPKCR